MLWDVEVAPDLVGIAAGTLDDTGWLAPKLHVWARSAQGWVEFPEEAEVLQQSNLGHTT